MNERAAKPEFLPHAARQLLCLPVGEGRKPGAAQKLGNSPLPFVARLSKQAAEEFDVFVDTEVRIKVFAESLRHIGDAGADGVTVRGIRHVAVEHEYAAGLNLARAGDDAEQCRLTDPVGTDQADHAAGGEFEIDRVERHGVRIALRDLVQARDWPGRFVHCGGNLCSEAGHAAAGSVLT